MALEAGFHSDNMRVTINRSASGMTVWASLHEKDKPAHMSPLTIYLSDRKPAELAAWQALSDALAAQDVVEEL